MGFVSFRGVTFLYRRLPQLLIYFCLAPCNTVISLPQRACDVCVNVQICDYDLTTYLGNRAERWSQRD
jgi:hypothetical protein